MNPDKTVLVTGINGFVVRNFEKYSRFRNIRKISLRTTAPADIDFTGIDVVLHLAAIVHCNRKTLADEYYKINRDLSVSLAIQAKSSGVGHFIFMSTVKVYGDFSSGQILTETSSCNPQDHYGRSKYEAELILRGLSDENFCVSIIRTPVVYGNGMKANMLKLEKLVRFFPLLPFKGVNNKRHYIFTENLTGFIDRIIEVRKTAVFLAMDTQGVSTEDIVRYFGNAMNKHILLFRCPDLIFKILKHILPAMVDRLFGSVILDNTQTRSILSYDPPYSTREGIEKMYRI